MRTARTGRVGVLGILVLASLCLSLGAARATASQLTAAPTLKLVQVDVFQQRATCDARLVPTQRVDVRVPVRFVAYYRISGAHGHRPSGSVRVTGLPNGPASAPLTAGKTSRTTGFLYSDLTLASRSILGLNLTATFTLSLGGRSLASTRSFASGILPGCMQLTGPQIQTRAPQLLHRSHGHWLPTKTLAPNESTAISLVVQAQREQAEYTITSELYRRVNDASTLVHTFHDVVPGSSGLQSALQRYSHVATIPTSMLGNVLAGEVVVHVQYGQSTFDHTRIWLFTSGSASQSAAMNRAIALSTPYQILHRVGYSLRPTTTLRAGESALFVYYPYDLASPTSISDAYVSITQNDSTIVPDSSLVPDVVNGHLVLDSDLLFSSSNVGAAYAYVTVSTSTPSMPEPLRFTIS